MWAPAPAAAAAAAAAALFAPYNWLKANLSKAEKENKDFWLNLLFYLDFCLVNQQFLVFS